MDLSGLKLPTLDRSKPFGEHHPPWNDAHFEQGGFHFDVDGKIVEDTLTPEAVAKLRKMKAIDEADAAADRARRAALKKAGIEADDPELTTKALDALAAQADKAPEAIDLVAWATAKAAYPFSKVRGFLAEEHNFLATDTRSAIAFMVDQKMIDEADVKIKGA